MNGLDVWLTVLVLGVDRFLSGFDGFVKLGLWFD